MSEWTAADWRGPRDAYLRVDVLTRDGIKVGELEHIEETGQVEESIYQEIRAMGSLTVLGDRDDWLTIRLRPVHVYTYPKRGEFPLGVFLPSTSGAGFDGSGAPLVEVSLANRLQVLTDDGPLDTYSLPAGTPIIEAVRAILTEHGEGSHAIADSDKTLRLARSWDHDATWLRVVNDLLHEAGYPALDYDRQGTAVSSPYVATGARPTLWHFVDGEDSIRLPEVPVTADYTKLYNRVKLVATSSGEEPEMVAIAENKSDGPLAYDAIERWKTRRETVDAADQEALQANANRLRDEASQLTVGATITHAWLPFLTLNARVRTSDSVDQLDLTSTITRMTIPLDPAELATTEVGTVMRPDEWISLVRTKERTPITWATVTQTAPLQIRPDGDDEPMAAEPGTLTDVSTGDRVAVYRNGTQLIVVGSTGNTGGVPTGVIQLWPGEGENLPSGWLICNGGAVSRTEYSRLFAVIGTQYGAGNGSTTFNLPDFQGRVPVGNSANPGDGGRFNVQGKKGGALTHTLTVAELPSHQHMSKGHLYQSWEYYGSDKGLLATMDHADWQPAIATGEAAGGGAAHNNVQPYITMRYIIRT